MPAGVLGAASASMSASAACAWTAWASATLRFLLFFTPGSAAEGSMMGGMMGSSVPLAPAFWAVAIASYGGHKKLGRGYTSIGKRKAARYGLVYICLIARRLAARWMTKQLCASRTEEPFPDCKPQGSQH